MTITAENLTTILILNVLTTRAKGFGVGTEFGSQLRIYEASRKGVQVSKQVGKSKSVAVNRSQQLTPGELAETIAAIVDTKTIGQAAERLQLDRTTIYQRMNNYPQIKDAVEKMKEQALLNLQQGSLRASEVVIEHLEHKEKGLEAAQDLLDRVGISSKTTNTAIQVNSIGGEMGIEFITGDTKNEKL